MHESTNLLIFGAIDDLWQNPQGEFIVVDYKATAKNEEITALDKDWHEGYKRQMEVYQWLLRRNGYAVSDTGYFVCCNGKADKIVPDCFKYLTAVKKIASVCCGEIHSLSCCSFYIRNIFLLILLFIADNII